MCTVIQAPTNHKAEYCDKVKGIVCGAREEAYGTVQKNFKDIADMWSIILRREITPVEVAHCMAAMKLCRLSHSKEHEDSVIDIGGYMACAYTLINDRK